MASGLENAHLCICKPLLRTYDGCPFPLPLLMVLWRTEKELGNPVIPYERT